jgi:hypothetical protein
LAAAVFVPDEEAARLIDAWLAATDAPLAEGLWPEWSTAAQGSAAILPAGHGACLRRVPWPGRPVVGRTGGIVPHVVYAPLEELPDVADWWTRVRGEAVAATSMVLAGRSVVVLHADDPSPSALADTFHRLAFHTWWLGRMEAGEGTPEAPPGSDDEDPALGVVEGRVLLEALRVAARSPRTAETAVDLRRAATTFALVRRDRRAPLEEEAVAAERRAETAFGLAAYVGWRAAGRLGAPWLDPAAAAALAALSQLSPETRGAATGRGLAQLLDALDAVAPVPQPPRDWRLEVDQGTPLDAALERRVRFDGGPRDDALVAAALRRHGYERLARAERARVEQARRARLALVEQILAGSGTLIVCEVGGLGAPRVASERAPEAVNAGLAVYPEGGVFSYPCGVTVAATGTPVAYDRRGGLLQLRVRARLAFAADGEGIAPRPVAFEDGLTLSVGALRIAAAQGEIHPIDGGYLLRLFR